MGKYTNAFDHKLKTVYKRKYERIQLRTFMTGPEWRNVEMAEEFARYLKNDNSMFHFPYFKQVRDLWRTVGKSYKAARKYNSHGQIWFSTNYMFMCIFVAFFTTLELAPKGLMSLIMKRFVKKDYSSDFQEHLAEHFSRYAKKLQTTPFYEHNYAKELRRLKRNYHRCKRDGDLTTADKVSYALVAFDLWARKWISKPLSYFLSQNVQSDTYDKTDIIVKHRVENEKDPKKAIRAFKVKLALAASDCEVKLAPAADTQVYAKHKSGTTHTNVYARLRAPRYGKFKESLKELADQDIFLRKSAGNDRVQVKVKIRAESTEELQQFRDAAKQVAGADYLYSYRDRIHKYMRYCMFDVPVKNLYSTVEKFEKISGENDKVKVKFIHNF